MWCSFTNRLAVKRLDEPSLDPLSFHMADVLLCLVLQIHQLAVSLFRMIGALSRTQTIGSTIGCGPSNTCCMSGRIFSADLCAVDKHM
jgi:hypothetical protein